MASLNPLKRIDKNAKSFSKTLMEVADVIDADLETAIRLSVLNIFKNIIMMSPVDRGSYRASHSITNSQPGDKEALKEGEFPGGGGNQGLAGAAWDDRDAWTWHIGEGTIFIFNNQPYALKLEVGHSKQAAGGIYAAAIASYEHDLQLILSESKTLK